MFASNVLNCSTPKRQKGIATVLIVVLVGLGLTATSMGIVHSVRSTQQKQIASHSITHAQAGAWTGVEVFRRYLAAQTTNQLAALALNQSIDFTLPGTTNVVNAVITDRVAPSGSVTKYQIKSRLTYSDLAAKSTASLEVIYEYSPPSNNNGVSLNGELNFHRSTSLSGGITIHDASGNNTGRFNVNGSLNLSNIGLTGVVNLNVTGDLTLGSAVPALTAKANGRVLLNGAASVYLLEGLGGVRIMDGAKATYIRSNGLVELNADGSTEVSTTGNVAVAGYGTHAKINANGNYTHAASAAVTLAQIRGTSSITTTNNPRVGTLTSLGNVSCTSNSWNNYTSIQTQGTATGCRPGTNLRINQPNLTVPTVTALTPYTMTKPRIDVWPLKNTANYVFEPELGKIKVTVNNVNGLTDGVYYLGVHTFGTTVLRDALCRSVTTAGVCVDSSASTRTICNGQSIYNSCFSYDLTTNRFTINSKNIAPGAMWFKGNLLLNNGNYYNTFLATLGIEVGGATTVTSVNYAEYTNTCNTTYQGATSFFTGLYPKNFCNTSNSTLISLPLGNPALVAGGFDPAQGGSVFSGGDIRLAASNVIYGSVLSGDTLTTGGSTVVRGYLTAAALTTETDVNTLGGSTTIDLRNLPSSYSPHLIPDMTTPPQDPDVARVLWSRFL